MKAVFVKKEKENETGMFLAFRKEKTTGTPEIGENISKRHGPDLGGCRTV